MPSFADEMVASFPPQVALPDEMRLTLDWLEANGCVRTYTQTKTRYASLFVPAVEGNTLSNVTFNPVDPTHVHHWGQIDDLSAQRLAPFIRTTAAMAPMLRCGATTAALRNSCIWALDPGLSWPAFSSIIPSTCCG